MVSVGSEESQRTEVARVASTVFGRSFEPDQIVSETLAPSLDNTGTRLSKQELHEAITAPIDADAAETELRKHPVAVWLENRIALEERDGRLARRVPMGFGDVVTALAEDSGAPEDRCRLVLEDDPPMGQCRQPAHSGRRLALYAPALQASSVHRSDRVGLHNARPG